MNKQILIPAKQKFSCQNCGKCCQDWYLPLTAEDKKRLENLKWSKTFLDKIGEKQFQIIKGDFYLAHRKNGTCVFRDEEKNECMIHKKFSFKTKPLGCRIYPLNIGAAFSGSVSVACRYDCPAVVQDIGNPISVDEISEYIPELQLRKGFSKSETTGLTTNSLVMFLNNITEKILVKNENSLLSKQIAHIFSFTNEVSKLGDAFLNDTETMKVLYSSLLEKSKNDVSLRDMKFFPLKRMIFRMLITTYFLGDDEAILNKNILKRFSKTLDITKNIFGFANLKTISRDSLDVTWKKADVFNLSEERFALDAQDVIARYIKTKIQSFQFFGEYYYGENVFTGIKSLCLAYKLSLMIAAIYSSSDNSEIIQKKHVQKALQTLAHSWGRSPLLKKSMFRFIEKY
ncbi:MAG: YkgJ family cysteine cluster protein [Verrucomicrobiota bacterium]|nr:YkgJ family cysteine cluster protein [Verrucomicrobiota bacterium]